MCICVCVYVCVRVFMCEFPDLNAGHVEYLLSYTKDYLIVRGLYNWPIFLGNFTIMYMYYIKFKKIFKIINIFSKPIRLTNFF